MDKFVCSICKCTDNLVLENDSCESDPDIYFTMNKKEYAFSADLSPIRFPYHPNSFQMCLNCGWVSLNIKSIQKAIKQLIKHQHENPDKKYMPDISSEDSN